MRASGARALGDAEAASSALRRGQSSTQRNATLSSPPATPGKVSIGCTTIAGDDVELVASGCRAEGGAGHAGHDCSLALDVLHGCLGNLLGASEVARGAALRYGFLTSLTLRIEMLARQLDASFDAYRPRRPERRVSAAAGVVRNLVLAIRLFARFVTSGPTELLAALRSQHASAVPSSNLAGALPSNGVDDSGNLSALTYWAAGAPTQQSLLFRVVDRTLGAGELHDAVCLEGLDLLRRSLHIAKMSTNRHNEESEGCPSGGGGSEEDNSALFGASGRRDLGRNAASALSPGLEEMPELLGKAGVLGWMTGRCREQGLSPVVYCKLMEVLALCAAGFQDKAALLRFVGETFELVRTTGRVCRPNGPGLGHHGGAVRGGATAAGFVSVLPSGTEEQYWVERRMVAALDFLAALHVSKFICAGPLLQGPAESGGAAAVFAATAKEAGCAAPRRKAGGRASLPLAPPGEHLDIWLDLLEPTSMAPLPVKRGVLRVFLSSLLVSKQSKAHLTASSRFLPLLLQLLSSPKVVTDGMPPGPEQAPGQRLASGPLTVPALHVLWMLTRNNQRVLPTLRRLKATEKLRPFCNGSTGEPEKSGDGRHEEGGPWGKNTDQGGDVAPQARLIEEADMVAFLTEQVAALLL